jgi:hypothetical protein
LIAMQPDRVAVVRRVVDELERLTSAALQSAIPEGMLEGIAEARQRVLPKSASGDAPRRGRR